MARCGPNAIQCLVVTYSKSVVALNLIHSLLQLTFPTDIPGIYEGLKIGKLITEGYLVTSHISKKKHNLNKTRYILDS